jgi:HSP20 family protein
MSLMRWEPFRDTDEFFRRGWPGQAPRAARSAEGGVEPPAVHWTPGADISESEQEFLVRAELPGVRKEDVRITVEHGTITISGERRMEKEDKTTRYHRIESFHGSFSRSFGLPDTVDVGAIRAESKDGVLLVHLPKKVLEKPRPVEIKVG